VRHVLAEGGLQHQLRRGDDDIKPLSLSLSM